jgi:hypothetical protein
MITFAEIVKNVENLSFDELNELQVILQIKKEKEILAAIEDARKESAEGKTISLSSKEDIKNFLEKLAKNED